MFNIEIEFQKGNTYYIRIRGAINCTGRYRFLFKAYLDDYSDSSAYAYNLGDVYNNKSISGSLSTEQHEDVDYFCFTSSRNALFEIYTEGNVRAIGRLFYENGLFLTNDYGGGEGDNFKITYYIEAGKTYYLAVEQAYWEYTLTDYTLKFKFICDWENKVNDPVNEQYLFVSWIDNDQTTTPNLDPYDLNVLYVYRSRDFVTNRAKSEYRDRIILDIYNVKKQIKERLQSTAASIVEWIVDYGLSLIKGPIDTVISFAKLLVSETYVSLEDLYNSKCVDIEGTDNYLIVSTYVAKIIITDIGSRIAMLIDSSTPQTNGELNEPSSIYLGRDYRKGAFATFAMIELNDSN